MLDDIKFHPMQTLKGIQNSRKITMTAQNCRAFSWCLELAAADAESRTCGRVAERLRQSAAEWRAVADARI